MNKHEQLPTKGRIMGEAADQDPSEKGGISSGTTAGKGNGRFTGFSVLLGNQRLLTHAYWFYWEWTILRKGSEAFHTFKAQQLHRCLIHLKSLKMMMNDDKLGRIVVLY